MDAKRARLDGDSLRLRRIAEARKFDPAEPRNPHSGEWVKVGELLKKAVDLAGRQHAPSRGLGVRQSLQDAPDVKTVNAVVRSEASRLGSVGLYVNFQGHDVQTAREHGEGILRGLESFPRVTVSVSHETHPGGIYGAYAITRASSIQFNTTFARPAGREEYLSALKMDLEQSWHPVGTDHPTAVSMHEFGHAVDYFFTTMVATPNGAGLVPKREFQDATDRLAAEMAAKAGMPVEEYIQSQLGGYALKSKAEMFAEAFADAMANGDKASDLSRAVMALVEDRYRRFEEASPR